MRFSLCTNDTAESAGFVVEIVADLCEACEVVEEVIALEEEVVEGNDVDAD